MTFFEHTAEHVKKDIWPRAEIQRQLDALGTSKDANIDKCITVLLHDEDVDGAYFDTMAAREVVGKTTWRGIDYETPYWTDKDTLNFCTFCREKYNFRPTVKAANEALRACTTDARNGRMIHPLRSYMDDLRGTWDGTPRIGSVLTEVCGTPKDAYVEDVMQAFLVGAVSRIYKPGSKFDSVLTLHGGQGSGKSSFASLLAPGEGELYAALDFSMMDDIKQTGELLLGKFVVELEEMGGLRKTSQRKVKAGISRKADRFREAYGIHGEDHYRKCVFIATVNPEEGRGILTDMTGNRRYWTVEAPGRGLTYDQIEAIMDSQRDQIWAEAIYYYDQGRQAILSDDAKKEAERRQQELLDVDHDMADTIRDYLSMPLPCKQEQWCQKDIAECAQEQWYKNDIAAMRAEWRTWRRLDDDRRKKLLPAADKLDGQKRYPRQWACVAEIWQVALGNDRAPDRREAQQVTQLFAAGQIAGWTYDRKGCKVCGEWGRKPPILPA